MGTENDTELEWDEWRERALSLGVSKDLAELGSTLMRESYFQRWPAEIQEVCGWEDDGFAMLAMARRDPEGTRRRWQEILRHYDRRERAQGRFAWDGQSRKHPPVLTGPRLRGSAEPEQSPKDYRQGDGAHEASDDLTVTVHQ
ncbi:hypothetical protein HAQ00_07980 [Acidithiobacillus caldus ATCC 51756]|uniref:hypothetical protein n=1 Tax=Acidithiobacillus caldus TaxID=33059 RepID=UPI001C06E248|nr:hypothetical protein [Acidithiobacillus caldus]MBU2735665.1 hypothetical protein [Acidithiobacillus caldus ATCC 51756]